MRIHTYLIVLLLACTSGGLLLLGGISWFHHDVEDASARASRYRLAERDFLRFGDSFRQWLLLCDLVLGSDTTHLLAEQDKLARIASQQLHALEGIALGSDVANEIDDLTGFIARQRERLKAVEAIGAESRRARLDALLDASDSDSESVPDAIAKIESGLRERFKHARAALKDAQGQRAWLTVLLSLGYLAYMFLVWRWTARTISSPLAGLSASASHACDKGEEARFSMQGPQEVRALATSFARLVESLEKRVRERTLHLEEANDRLDLARLDAERANRAKSAFLANMSHEMRTPMHGIINFAQLGKRRSHEASDEKLERYFTRIDTSSKRLLDLLTKLIDLSELEAEKVGLQVREARLLPLVECVIDELAALVGEGQSLCVGSSTDVIVECDVAKVGQVLRNLIANSLKFSPEDGIVEVTLEERLKAVRLSVLDRGIGIPDDELESIFDSFVQSARTDTGAGGTGLGLSISRAIVQLHGGRIWAEQRPGGGSIVTFELPHRRAEAKLEQVDSRLSTV